MICVPTSLGSVDGADFLMLWEKPALVRNGSTSARRSSAEPPESLQTKLRKCGKHRVDIKAGLRDPYCLLLIVTPGQSSVRNGVAGNPTPL